jgi:hypothetical protein
MIVVGVAPLIGLLGNTIRIAILTLVAGSGNGKGSFWFDFFHQDTGSLIFSGVAVFVFGLCYLKLLEPELSPLPQELPPPRDRSPQQRRPEPRRQSQSLLEPQPQRIERPRPLDLTSRVESKP